MMVALDDKIIIKGDAVVLINQIELILAAYKDGLLEAGETEESADKIILLAVENASKLKDYYRFTTVDKEEEAEENALMLILKHDILEELPEKRTYADLIGKAKIDEKARRIRR